jgi:hypothetical protein
MTLLRPYSNWKGMLVFLAIGLGIVGVAYLVRWLG